MGLMVAMALMFTSEASAQRGPLRGSAEAVQSVSFGYFLIDFAFDGEATPPFRFDFDQPAIGLVYTRPNFLATLAVGDQDASEDLNDLRLLDVSLTTWGALRPEALSRGSTRFYLPIVLYGNHRRVSPRSSEENFLETFNVTMLGLGGGLGLDRTFGDVTFFQARANPIIGFATSSLTDAFGLAYLMDADAQLHWSGLFGKFGLSLGYTFRYQVWNINASGLFPEATDDLFDYNSLQHLIRVGLNW